MSIIAGIGDLMQAQMAANSTKMLHNLQTNMSHEKQIIKTEIKLDDHSTSIKDNRLDQISSQTEKTSDYISESIQTEQKKITKAQQDQQSDTTDATDAADTTTNQKPQTEVKSTKENIVISTSTNKNDASLNSDSNTPKLDILV